MKSGAASRCWSMGVQERSEDLECELLAVVAGLLLNVPRHRRGKGGARRQLATRPFVRSRDPP